MIIIHTRVFNFVSPSYSSCTGHLHCHDYHCIPGDACIVTPPPSRVVRAIPPFATSWRLWVCMRKGYSIPYTPCFLKHVFPFFDGHGLKNRSQVSYKPISWVS